MTEFTVVVSPSFDKRGHRRHDRFDVRVRGHHEIICEATRQPLLDAGRELKRRGADSGATLCMVHASAPDIVTLRAPIGVAAQYDVMGEKFVRRKPLVGPMPGSVIENDASSAPRMLRRTKANAGGPHRGSTTASATPAPTSSPASFTSRPPSSSTAVTSTSSIKK